MAAVENQNTARLLNNKELQEICRHINIKHRVWILIVMNIILICLQRGLEHLLDPETVQNEKSPRLVLVLILASIHVFLCCLFHSIHKYLFC